MSIETMKQALEALNTVIVDVKTTPNSYETIRQAIAALRAAIEQSEKPRQWQGLTLFDKVLLRTTHAPMKELYYDKETDCSVCAEGVIDWENFFTDIESKLKEKNT